MVVAQQQVRRVSVQSGSRIRIQTQLLAQEIDVFFFAVRKSSPDRVELLA